LRLEPILGQCTVRDDSLYWPAELAARSWPGSGLPTGLTSVDQHGPVIEVPVSANREVDARHALRIAAAFTELAHTI
jgi:hypothetical protein